MPPNKARWRELFEASERSTALAFELALAYTRDFTEDSFGWLMLGRCLGKLHRYKEGLHALFHGLAMAGPQYRSVFYIELGHIYRGKSRLKQAEKSYRQALAHEASPKQTTLVFLGSALFAQGPGAFEKAKKLFLRAIEIAPETSDEACFNLAGVFTAQREYALAQEYYRRALEIEPENKLYRDWLSDVEQADRKRPGS